MKSPERFSLLLIQTLECIVLCLACHRAEYQIGQECCPMCPAGTRVNKHCTEFRSTSCLPCEEETYMDEPTGTTKCFVCRICDPGSGLKVKTACSSTSNTVCEPQEKYFCVELSQEGNCVSAQKHKSCHPGEFIQQPGRASTDTVCAPCAEGTFSDGSLSKCQPHTKCELMDKDTAKEGTSDSDTECKERTNNGLVIGASVVVSFVILISIPAVVFIYKKKRKPTPDEENKDRNTTQELL